ncbi:MAG: hypothetical protein V1895_03140 [Parcubacteria group bacterium]
MPVNNPKVTLEVIGGKLEVLSEKMDRQFTSVNGSLRSIRGKLSHVALKSDIDKLARSIAEGFVDLEKRLRERINVVEAKIDGLNKRFDVLLITVADIKKRIKNAATRSELRALEHRLAVVEVKVGIRPVRAF